MIYSLTYRGGGITSSRISSRRRFCVPYTHANVRVCTAADRHIFSYSNLLSTNSQTHARTHEHTLSCSLTSRDLLLFLFLGATAATADKYI